MDGRQAAVLVLRGFQGLSHASIAAVLGISEGSSKSHYSLAVRKLREWTRETASEKETAEHTT